MGLSGNLEDIALGDIFRIIHLSRKSGVLLLQRGAREGRIAFVQGDIVLAISSESAQPPEVVLARDGVDSALRQKVREVVRSFCDWPGGRYDFEVVDNFDPSAVFSEPLLARGLSPREVFAEAPSPEEIEEGASPRGGLEAAGDAADGETLSLGVAEELPLLKGMLHELHDPSHRAEIVLLVLRYAAVFMNRAAVFLVKEKEVVAIGQFGIEAPKAGKRGRVMRFALGEDSPFAAVLRRRMPAKVRFDDGPWWRSFRDALGGETPEEAFVGPILNEGEPVALLYGDNLPHRRRIGNTESLEIFLSQAGVAMEKAILERRLLQR